MTQFPPCQPPHQLFAIMKVLRSCVSVANVVMSFFRPRIEDDVLNTGDSDDFVFVKMEVKLTTHPAIPAGGSDLFFVSR